MLPINPKERANMTPARNQAIAKIYGLKRPKK